MLNLPIKILDRIVVDVETITVTFSNIDTLVAQWDALAHVTSRHLVLIINARTIDPSNTNTQFLRFNGSLVNDYYYQRLSGVNVTDSAGRTDGANAINLPPIAGATIANMFGGSQVLIPHAFNTVNHKTVLALGGAGEYAVEAVAGRWAQAAAITSITLTQGVGDEYVVGSEFLLGVVDERYLVEEIEDAGGGTFDNIPQGEGDLAAIGYLRSARAAVVEDEVVCAINDDTVAGNYPAQEVVGRGGGTSAARPNFEVGIVTAAAATADVFGVLAMVISQFTKDNQPHFISQSGYHELSGATGEVRVMSGRRDNIEPINKLYIAGSNFDDFAAGSLLSLYRVPKRLIDRQILTADQTTITFNNIPDYYEALILHIYARSDRPAVTSDSINVMLNGDAVLANYDGQWLRGAIAAVSSSRSAARRNWFEFPAVLSGEAEYGGGTLLLPGYSKNDRHKHGIVVYASVDNVVGLHSTRWENTDPITSIALTDTTGDDFLAGSVFELEGVLRKEGLPADAGMRWG